MSKGKPSTFNPIRDRKNVTAGKTCAGIHTMREKDGSMSVRSERKIAAEFGLRTNVWKGNTRGQEDFGKNLPHPAMMPKWLARDLIASFSNAGEMVLDPLCGSGTVCMEAHGLARHAIGFYASEEYIQLARKMCDVTPGFRF